MTYYITCPCCEVALKVVEQEVEIVKPWYWRCIEGVKTIKSFLTP